MRRAGVAAALLALAVAGGGARHAPAPARPTSAGVAIDVRDVSLGAVIGEVDGTPVRVRSLDRRSRDALGALWRAIHAAKREALGALEDEAILRFAPFVPPAPAPASDAEVEARLAGRRVPAAAGPPDALVRHAIALDALREARRAHLAAARRRVALEERVPPATSDREARWPEVVARVGGGAGPGAGEAATIRDDALEAAARLRLYRLRGRVHAELARAFDAHADALRLAREARRRGLAPDALVDAARRAAPAVGEHEVDAFLTAHPTSEAPRARVREALAGRHRAEAELGLRDRLREAMPARLRVAPPAPPRLDAAGARPGPGDPPVVLLAYTSLRCRRCAETERLLDALARGPYGDRVRIERRPHFPEAALPLLEDAIAARCAAEQGRDAAFRERLLAALAAGGAADGRAAAAAVAPDAEALGRCLVEPHVRARVLAERAEAERLGLDDTPSFLVNGLPLVGFQGRERLEAVVAAELAARTNATPPDTGGGTP